MNKSNRFSFEEWIKRNPELVEEAGEEDCEECGGDGETECYECGHIRDCTECEGTGKKNNLRKMYEDQLLKDTQNAERWVNAKPIKAPADKEWSIAQ